MWVLLFAIVSLSGEALMLPPLPFGTEKSCTVAAEEMKANMAPALEPSYVAAVWRCIEQDGEGV